MLRAGLHEQWVEGQSSRGGPTVPVSAPSGPSGELVSDPMTRLWDERSRSIPGAEGHTGWDLPPPVPHPHG